MLKKEPIITMEVTMVKVIMLRVTKPTPQLMLGHRDKEMTALT